MATDTTTEGVPQAEGQASSAADWPFSYSRLSGLPGMLHIVALRLWSHLRLMLALLVGFAVAVALVVSIPVYAEAVSYRVLRDEFTQNTYQNQLRFDFLYRYLGAHGGLLAADYNKLDAYFQNQAAQAIPIPIVQRGRYVSTDKRSLAAPGTVAPSFASVNMASADGFEQHVELISGRLPRTAPDGPAEVLMTEGLAERLQPKIDQVYYVLDSGRNASGNGTLVRISGIWRPKDPQEPYWFYSEMLSDDILFTTPEIYTTRLMARDPRLTSVALWFFATDGSVIRSAAVPRIQGQIDRSAQEFAALLPGAQLDVSPGGVLPRHQQRVRDLTLTLTIFSIPLLGLVAYFVILIAGLVIQRQSMEIAMLRSRGVSRLQVLAIYLLEGLLLGLLALIPGPWLGELAAMLMTWVRSFLDIAPVRDLPIELTGDAWLRAWQILALLIAASLIPAFAAAGHTIVSYKSERARLTRGPIWQRLGIDLILLALVVYGYVQLRQRGTIAFLGVQASTGDPFTSPLLLLAPTLYIIALGLLSLRLFPPILTVLTWLSDGLRGIVAVTALRYLARTSRTYIGPVLLLVLTLSLSIFTASMAQTLDRQLFDQIYYSTGGDMQITDRGRPERQGLFGLLSVGFVASAFLTALGFLFYSGLSFQRRFIEFGMLRAIGLSTGQLSALLAAEQALILGIGAIAGTLIGVSASQLFIPFMQVASGPHAQTPPFLVEIAWERIGIIYLIFAIMLLGAVTITLLLLRRMKLFQAVKLGETI
jgi:putative ABC transport system permease protein